MFNYVIFAFNLNSIFLFNPVEKKWRRIQGKMVFNPQSLLSPKLHGFQSILEVHLSHFLFLPCLKLFCFVLDGFD